MTSDRITAFWRNVDKSGDCWIWTAGRTSPVPYGKFWNGHKVAYTHRISWELASGKPVPQGLSVCHHCDNPPCVNPSHLFVGTQSDNARDMVSKGRDNAAAKVHIGEQHYHAILSESDVRDIRRMRREGVRVAILAEKYHVSRGAIHCAAIARSWKHLAP